ncbi:MAG: hypothetical protein KDA46_07970 [Parvularculaceae bacterium]|nr:hypothetical protein [Parvularculaceae bacterium]
MSLFEAMPLAFRDALVIIGALCVVAGMVVRQLTPAGRGLGMSLIVVGCMMVIAGPLGRTFGFW